MTNFKKLVGWDANFYKSLPDDECLICLSKKELYVIGEALRQVSWSTRWHGDTTGLDLDDISANIELKIQGAIMCNCQFITDCIDDAANGTNQALLQAIYNATQAFSSTSIDSSDTTVFGDRYDIGSQPISTISLDDGMGGCDLDKLWGAVYSVVSRLAQLGLDLLEVYTSKADAIQRTSELIRAVPFVGSIAGGALSLAADLAQDIENSYNAYQTQAVIDSVACDIFCSVQAECRYPTFDEILEYYASGRGYDLATVTTMSYATLFNQALGNLVAGSLVWHGVQLFALGTMYLDGEVLGRTGTSWIDIWAYEGEKSPSNLHLTLCACPALSWSWSYFANECNYGLPSGWSLNIVVGSCGNFSGSFDGIAHYAGAAAADITFEIIPPPGVVVSSVSFEAAANTTGGTRTMSVTQETVLYDAGLAQNWNTYNLTPNESGKITWVLHQSASGFNGVGVRQITIEW